MKFAAFDLEIAQEIPEGVTDWWSVAPLGITCAAVAHDDAESLHFGDDRMSPTAAQALVFYLTNLVERGYTLVTLNGAGFDFRVLAQESGMDYECRLLARRHVDIFFYALCRLGYGPGLDRLAKGMGLPGKTEGIDGARAPAMWRNGQRMEVLAYCAQDTRTTLEIARQGALLGGVQWNSKAGNRVGLDFERWLSVAESLDLPLPDTAWMKGNGWSREKFTAWMGD